MSAIFLNDNFINVTICLTYFRKFHSLIQLRKIDEVSEKKYHLCCMTTRYISTSYISFNRDQICKWWCVLRNWYFEVWEVFLCGYIKSALIHYPVYLIHHECSKTLSSAWYIKSSMKYHPVVDTQKLNENIIQ